MRIVADGVTARIDGEMVAETDTKSKRWKLMNFVLKTGEIPRIFGNFDVLRFWARLMQNGDQNQGPEAPKSTPEAPKSTPEAPKSTPGGSKVTQDAQKYPQNDPSMPN